MLSKNILSLRHSWRNLGGIGKMLFSKKTQSANQEAQSTSGSPTQATATTPSNVQKKREIRQQKKLEEEKVIQSLKNLETVVDQDELTKEKLEELISVRKEQLKAIAQDNVIPQEAKLTSFLITAPLFLGSIGLNYCGFSGMYLDMMPTYVMGLVKYAAIQVCFMSGIHWGFAMSMHDNQLDSIRSTPEVRTHFTLATLPIFASLGTIAFLCYGPVLMPMAKLASVGILTGLHLYNLGLDKKVVDSGNAPKWFWNLKLAIFFFSIAGLLGLGNIYLSFNHLTQFKNPDPYRKYIPSREELLKSNLKLSNSNTDNVTVNSASSGNSNQIANASPAPATKAQEANQKGESVMKAQAKK